MKKPVDKGISFAKRKNREANKWPRVNVKVLEEPHFLFIMTPKFSGAAALINVLNSSRGSTLLHKRGEGQWLIPGLREDRWNAEKEVDWQSVRSTWLQRVMLVKSLVQGVDVVIEQSPPNMVRMDGMLATFPNHTLLTFKPQSLRKLCRNSASPWRHRRAHAGRPADRRKNGGEQLDVSVADLARMGAERRCDERDL